MAKPEWGKKVTCDKCQNKFYDMKKTSPVCPKCDNIVKPVSLTKAKRASVAAKAPDKKEGVELTEDDLVIEGLEDEDDEDEDDSLIVPDDDLDDTDDDLSEVKEHMGPGDDE